MKTRETGPKLTLLMEDVKSGSRACEYHVSGLTEGFRFRFRVSGLGLRA